MFLLSVLQYFSVGYFILSTTLWVNHIPERPLPNRHKIDVRESFLLIPTANSATMSQTDCWCKRLTSKETNSISIFCFLH